MVTQCTCPTWPGTSNRIVTAAPNPLCPVHGDVRDTGFVIDSCVVCGGSSAGLTDVEWIRHLEGCTSFVLDSKDDYITAIEDVIELDHDNR